MSGSPENPNFSGKRPERSPEKSSFTRTCSRLSRYLKEKGSFGDMTLDMTCTVEMEEPTTMDLFPQQPGLSPPVPEDDLARRTDFSVNKSGNQDARTAPMTIMYSNQIIVFKDLPVDKAREVMILADKGCSHSIPEFNVNSFDAQMARSRCFSNIYRNSSKNVIPNSGSTSIQEATEEAALASNARDLPIMRRASLNRFLEKRKDRFTTRAPYPVFNAEAGPSEAAAGTKWWLGLDTKPLL